MNVFVLSAAAQPPTPLWVTLLVGIGGALVGGLATLIGVVVNQRSTAKISRKVDERHLRDEKAVRLRAMYAPFVKVSLVMDQIATEVGYGRTDETIEERDGRHEELIRDAMAEAQDHYAAALLDDATASVRDVYAILHRTFDAYMRTVRNFAMESGPGWLPASHAIDWTIEGQRIGDRDKPLAEKTMARIRAGLAKYGPARLSVDAVRGAQILTPVGH